MTGPIRVVGVGSPLGDDAVAWHVVRSLQCERDWGSGVEFYIVEGGQRLLEILDGSGVLILIDALAATEGNVAPGSVHQFEWPDERIESLSPGTTHHLRPAAALQLAATLDLLPRRVVICAIAGEDFTPQSGLSGTVAAAVPEATRQILCFLECGNLLPVCHSVRA